MNPRPETPLQIEKEVVEDFFSSRTIRNRNDIPSEVALASSYHSLLAALNGSLLSALYNCCQSV